MAINKRMAWAPRDVTVNTAVLHILLDRLNRN